MNKDSAEKLANTADLSLKKNFTEMASSTTPTFNDREDFGRTMTSVMEVTEKLEQGSALGAVERLENVLADVSVANDGAIVDINIPKLVEEPALEKKE